MSTSDDMSNEHRPSAASRADVKAQARQAGEDMKSAASDVAQSAQSEVEQKAVTAKRNVADEVSNVASALRSASEQLRDGSPQERTFAQVADSLANASETIRDKDFGEMARDLQSYARDNPAVFLGGAALLGFAAARFAKASAESDEAPSAAHNPHGVADTQATANRGVPSSASSATPPTIPPTTGGLA